MHVFVFIIILGNSPKLCVLAMVTCVCVVFSSSLEKQKETMSAT